MDVLVLVHASRAEALPALDEGVKVANVATLEAALTALRETPGPAVICSDGFDEGWLEPLGAAVRGRPAAAIEVRGERWDGHSHSELSAACRGVISGFRAGGVSAAIAALREPR
jgi:hypothetical protein